MKIYLAGKITGQRAFAEKWRENIIKKYSSNKLKFVNPMRRNQKGKAMKDFSKIVNGDKLDIFKSDCVLVYINDGASFGTSMEIMFAYQRDIPVIVVSKEKNLGAWLNYHSKIFTNFEEAFDYIKRWCI